MEIRVPRWMVLIGWTWVANRMRRKLQQRIATGSASKPNEISGVFDTERLGLRGWYRLRLRLQDGTLDRVAISAVDRSRPMTSFELVCGRRQFRCYFYTSASVSRIRVDADVSCVPNDAVLEIRPLPLVELFWKSLKQGIARAPVKFFRYFADPLDHFLITFHFPAPRPTLDNYQQWIAGREKAAIRARRTPSTSAVASERPEIGFLLTVCDPQPIYLKKALESVLGQSSPKWRLSIADDASSNPEVRTMLESYARNDERIDLRLREQRGGISAASNDAFALANSPLVACLDHDDTLAPQAAELVADHFSKQGECQMLFSDEDKIDERDYRFNPYFKPRRFSPELFYSCNYINHLTVHRAETIRALGGWRSEFDGAQDYDLNLRTIRRLGSDRIQHIPHILYHWRAIAGSAAADVGYKSYAIEKGRLALQDHFSDRPGTSVQIVSNTMYRIVREFDQSRAGVAVIVPFRDRPELLASCVDSVLNKTSYSNLQLVLIDNGSVEEKTLALLRSLETDPRVKIIADNSPFNYSRLNNIGVRATSKEYICLLNNDVEAVDSGWLVDMMSYAVQPDVGCVGAKLFYPGGSVQHAGIILGMGGPAGHAFLNAQKDDPGYFGRLVVASNYSAVTGACLVVKRDVFMKVDGLDEDALPISAFNDIDFCIKVQSLGLRNVLTPFARLIHRESASRGAENTPEKNTQGSFCVGGADMSCWKDIGRY